jgi:AcrR family transcriptional regulator
MPKKPFSPDEVASQRERIMDSAAQVMAEVGFHHLSMRKLASQLDMTASNIYNYFPSKESLLLNVRQRGFELAFRQINSALMSCRDANDALYQYTRQLIQFAHQRPGYYQLMFQPPKLTMENIGYGERQIALYLERLVNEWQQQATSVLTDAIAELVDAPRRFQLSMTLSFLTSIHGLVDCYHHKSMPELLEGVDLLANDLASDQVDFLVDAIRNRVKNGLIGTAESGVTQQPSDY